MATESRIRTFIAFKLPEPIISAIRRVQTQLKGYGLGVRWTAPQGIHLTLKFLGEVPTADLEHILEAMQAAAQVSGPLQLSARGLGVFPGIKNARVVWIGLAGEREALQAFQKGLEAQLVPLGFAAEKRPFKGHLTLGRAKKKVDPERLLKALADFKDFESEPFTLERITLFKSELTREGAVYSELGEATLGP